MNKESKDSEKYGCVAMEKDREYNENEYFVNLHTLPVHDQIDIMT